MQFDLFDAGANTILGAESYAEFKEKLRDSGCDKCALHAGRTNIVVDRGNPEAYIMTIGEGPGENEDKQALAFVGRAGKMFDKIMDAVGIDTNRDMLIVNVVKCRPPENRSPRAEEAAEMYLLLAATDRARQAENRAAARSHGAQAHGQVEDQLSDERRGGEVFYAARLSGNSVHGALPPRRASLQREAQARDVAARQASASVSGGEWAL